MHYYDIAVQEAEQKQEVERRLDLERQQAEASSGELKKKLEELKKQIQEKDAQVYTSHSIQIYSTNVNDACTLYFNFRLKH